MQPSIIKSVLYIQDSTKYNQEYVLYPVQSRVCSIPSGLQSIIKSMFYTLYLQVAIKYKEEYVLYLEFEIKYNQEYALYLQDATQYNQECSIPRIIKEYVLYLQVAIQYN